MGEINSISKVHISAFMPAGFPYFRWVTIPLLPKGNQNGFQGIHVVWIYPSQNVIDGNPSPSSICPD
jgi:hypothetical protein